MNGILDLYFDDDLIGRIRDAFEHQGTWFGKFACEAEGVPHRVLEFIEFCRDWHRRLDEDPKKETNPAEFDQFHDVLAPNRWTVRHGAAKQVIDQAPVFTDEVDICWVLESRRTNVAPH